MLFEPGQIVGDHEILAPIGQGGMGRVYRVRHKVLGRIEAMKVLYVDLSEDPEISGRFVDEMRTQARLDHPNIAKLFSTLRIGDQWVMFMEMVEGTPLSEYTGKHDRLPLSKIVDYTSQTLLALAHAHQHGVVHRDVKPSNLLVTSDGVVKLMDFGIAKSQEDTVQTGTGVAIGSVRYMSPEQVRGLRVDARSDIYSLGVVLYELAVGNAPFEREDSFALQEAQVYSAPKPPIELDRSLPRPFNDIILQALQKDPTRRFQNANEFRSALQLFWEAHDNLPFSPPFPAATWLVRTMKAVREAFSGNPPVQIDSSQAVNAKTSHGRSKDDVPTGPLIRNPTSDTAFIPAKVNPKIAEPARQRVPPPIQVPPPLNQEQAPVGEFTRTFRPPVPDKRPPGPPPSNAAAREPEKIVPAPPKQSEVGEFTEILKTRIPQPAAPPVAPPRLADSTPAKAPQEPGEFMRFFSSGPKAPPRVDASPKVAEPGPPPSPTQSGPGEFTRMLQAQFGPRAAPHLRPPPPDPLAPSAAINESTQIFKTASNAGPDDKRPPAPVPSSPEFTQLFGIGQRPPSGSSGTQTTSELPDVAITISGCADSNLIGRRMDLTRVPFKLGRDAAKNDFALSFDSAISSTHAQIDYENGEFLIADLESSNGTFLNGKQLKPGRKEHLLFGSHILLGSNTQLTFVLNELSEILDLAGRTFANGRYVLQEKLYSSSKSVLYSAEDTHLGLIVSVKVLSPGLSAYPGYRAQFKREAEIASRMSHPHICPVLDFGEASLGPNANDTSQFVVMKHLGSGNLAQRLAAGEPLSPALVVTWIEKICSALDYLHRQKVVHGAIKLSSIVFSEDEPYLTDFAFAVNVGDEQHRSIIGSPAYLAPEQWSGENPSAATDLYAIGVVTYHCLTGALPFENQERPKAREANFFRGPLDAREVARRNGKYDGFGPSVSKVLAQALARDPAERFSSGLEFGRTLKEALARSPVKKVQPTAATRPKIFISHHRPSSAYLAILIQQEFERLEYEVFVDSQQKDTVGRFPDKIESKIKKCDVFVCLLAPDTLGSGWVNREIEVALRERRPVIPVFQEGFQYSGTLEEFPSHVQELLRHDGVKFPDAQRHMVRGSLTWLCESVETLIRDRQRRRRAKV